MSDATSQSTGSSTGSSKISGSTQENAESDVSVAQKLADMPRHALPTAKLLGVGAGGAAAAVVLGTLVTFGLSGDVLAPLWGGLAVAVAMCLPAVVLKPWQPRTLSDWTVRMLAWQGIALLGSIAFGGVLYSATRPGPIEFGVTVAGGYLLGTTAQAVVYHLLVLHIDRQSRAKAEDSALNENR